MGFPKAGIDAPSWLAVYIELIEPRDNPVVSFRFELRAPPNKEGLPSMAKGKLGPSDLLSS